MPDTLLSIEEQGRCLRDPEKREQEGAYENGRQGMKERERRFWEKMRETGKFVLFLLVMAPVMLLLLMGGLAARGIGAVVEWKSQRV